MRRVVIIILIVLIFANIAVLVVLSNEEDFDSIPPLPENEIFHILNTELIPREKVTTFCVNESVIVLFYDQQGLANVYSHEGTFLYGLQVSTIKNGKGGIALKDGVLYIKARGNRMYVFKEDGLIQSFLHSEKPEEYERIIKIIEADKKYEIDGDAYHYLPETNKVVKQTSQGAMVSIISMPQINDSVRVHSMLLLLLIAGLAHFVRRTGDGLREP